MDPWTVPVSSGRDRPKQKCYKIRQKNSTPAKLKPVIAGKALNFKLGFQQKSDAVLKVRHTKF